MVECQKITNCPFFNDKMGKMPATSNLFKKKYCNSDFNECARYIIANMVGSSEIPRDLFPNQHERANQIIFEKKRVS